MMSIVHIVGYLIKYIKPHRTTVIITLALTALATGLGMVQPLFARMLIDRVLPEGDARLLLILLSAVVSLFMLSFAIKIANSYLYTRYSAKVLFKMREDLFSHLQIVPLSFFSKKRIGDIYSRIGSDITDIQGFLTDTIPNACFNLLTCVMTAGILLWLNWKMALLSFCFLPVGMLIISWLKPKVMVLTRKVAEKNADIAHFLIESLEGNRLIRAYGAGERSRHRLQDHHSKMIRFLMRHQILGAVSGSIPLMLTIINTLVVFGYGGFLVMDGALTIGSLVAFSIYQGRVFGPLQGLLDSFLVLQKVKVALHRVEEIMTVQPGLSQKGNRRIGDWELKGELVFKDICFGYEPDQPLFNDLTFQVPPGEITALVGPSGMGKTTLCHLAMRLMDSDAGSIALDGIDIRTLNTGWLRRQFALVSQDTFLFHDTILENIRFSNPEADDDDVMNAAKAACIHEFISTLPKGYDTIAGDRGVKLSGGQRQRISIAQAILRNPKILILDEATAFLDAQAEERLKETLNRLMKDKTIIIVSHRASTIRGATKIVDLEQLQGAAPREAFPLRNLKLVVS